MSSESDERMLDRALTAAHLYYVQDRTMDAIAKELATSRSSVSRLLSHARAAGIVDIRIRSPFDGPRLLEERLAERHGVTALVVPVLAQTAEVERLERVAVAAAHLLGALVDAEMTIGVAWGSTMAAVSRHLAPKASHGTTFVQLNGSGNTQTTGLEFASDILSRFAGAYGGTVQQFPVPAFFDDPETKRAMWRERSMRRILALHSAMSLVVFSVGASGSTVPSHVYAGGYLEEHELATLAAERVVGDVATVFYRADGSTDRIALNERATGPSFDLLRRVERRVCVVSGVSKIASVRGALAAGLVTDLVIDEAMARALAE